MTLPTDDPIHKTDLGIVLFEILMEHPELAAYFSPTPKRLEESWSTFDCIDVDSVYKKYGKDGQ